MAEENQEKKIEIKRITADDLDVTEIEIDTNKETIIVIDHEDWHPSR